MDTRAEQIPSLTGEIDDYGGVIITMTEPMDPEVFTQSLKASISRWREEGKKGVWLSLSSGLSNLIEAAVKEGFSYHHAEPSYLMLVCWISSTDDTIPANVSRVVGIRPLVRNQITRVVTPIIPFPRLALGAETVVVSDHLSETHQDFVRLITESKDVWDNKDLTCLGNEYLDTSIKSLDFCNAVDDCVKRSWISQMIIKFALKQFEMESSGTNKFARTLEELNKFKASGDPFDGGFFLLLESVYKQGVKLLERLQKQMKKLDKKLKNIKNWKKISNVIFVTSFLSVLIFSVVAAAVPAPPVVTAVAAALAVPVGSVGKWCNHLWKKYETAVKRQKDIVLSMRIGAYATKKDIDNIRVLVDKLKIETESMMHRVDFALKEEEEVALRLSMDEISKKFDVFTERIEEVGESATKCSKDITVARTIVLRHILSFPSSSDEEQGNL